MEEADDATQYEPPVKKPRIDNVVRVLRRCLGPAVCGLYLHTKDQGLVDEQ